MRILDCHVTAGITFPELISFFRVFKVAKALANILLANECNITKYLGHTFSPTILIASTRHLILSGSTSSLSQGNLDGFVRMINSRKVPANFVAGARQSKRASKPSAKICDPASSVSSISAKRPAPTSSTAAHKRSSASVDTDVNISFYGH
jgi:hypothetical protein